MGEKFNEDDFDRKVKQFNAGFEFYSKNRYLSDKEIESMPEAWQQGYRIRRKHDIAA